jgi:apyrase
VSITPTLKIQPGLSALEDDKPGIREHIWQLVQNASRIIPEEHHSKTPIYVMATAGMRLLLEEKMNQVVHFIDLLMRDSTVNPFSYSTSSDTRILSGEEEGVFAWITVNYLYESFTDITGEKPTVGILEMGGASTQIAFAPRGNVLADKFPVTIGRVTYPLYVHSYLDYGQNNVDKWLKGRLLRGNLSGQHISNPCMLKDDLETDPSFSRTFIGTGEPYKCIELLRQHVYKSDASRCQPKPCAIGSFYQPTLPPNMTFFAIGSYIYTLKPIGALAEDGQYIPSVGYDKAVEFCQKPVTEHRSRTPGNQLKFLGSKCMLGLYFALLLNHGYGFPNDTRHIYVRDKIGGQPPDWTLGAVLYESVQPGCAGTRPVYGLASTLRPTGGGAFFTYLSAAVVLCVCQLIIGHQNVKAWIHQHWSL